LAPDVLRAFFASRKTAQPVITYINHEVWAVGVLIYEMAYGTPPWRDYPRDPGFDYDPSIIPDLPPDVPAGGEAFPLPRWCGWCVDAVRMFPEFSDLYRSMLHPDPAMRPTCDVALTAVEGILAAPVPSIGVPFTGLPVGSPAPVPAAIVDTSESAPPTITVFVRDARGPAVAVVVDANGSVSSVIAAAVPELHPGEDPAKYKLLYCGAILNEATPVCPLLTDESSVFLVEPQVEPTQISRYPSRALSCAVFSVVNDVGCNGMCAVPTRSAAHVCPAAACWPEVHPYAVG
jgi:serine/threonine protein kinase